MQNRVTIALGVLLACICSAWATHCDMMASSTSKKCRKFHFSYISSPCLTNITSQSDSTSNFDVVKKKIIKNALFFTILHHVSAWWRALLVNTFSEIAPKKAIFWNTFFFQWLSDFEHFQKFFSRQNFLKCVMFGSNLASHIPPSGPLGISLPSFDIRGISPFQNTQKWNPVGVWNARMAGFHKK